jgi:hypothetical protein
MPPRWRKPGGERCQEPFMFRNTREESPKLEIPPRRSTKLEIPARRSTKHEIPKHEGMTKVE